MIATAPSPMTVVAPVHTAKANITVLAPSPPPITKPLLKVFFIICLFSVLIAHGVTLPLLSGEASRSECDIDTTDGVANQGVRMPGAERPLISFLAALTDNTSAFAVGMEMLPRLLAR
jgi:hypothetical protein